MMTITFYDGNTTRIIYIPSGSGVKEICKVCSSYTSIGDSIMIGINQYILIWEINTKILIGCTFPKTASRWLDNYVKTHDIDLKDLYDKMMKTLEFESMLDEMMNDFMTDHIQVKRPAAVLPIEHMRVHDNAI